MKYILCVCVLVNVLACHAKTSNNTGLSSNALEFSEFIAFQDKALRIRNYISSLPFGISDDYRIDEGIALSNALVSLDSPFVVIDEYRSDDASVAVPYLVTNALSEDVRRSLSRYFTIYEIENPTLHNEIMRKTSDLLDDEVITYFTFSTPPPPIYLVTFFDGKNLLRGIYQAPWQVYDKSPRGGFNLSNPNSAGFGEGLFDSVSAEEYYKIYA